MSSTQLTTFQDLYTDLLQRARINTSDATSLEQAKRYINIALHDIHLGNDYKFPWCERQLQIRTKAPYTTGTLTATNGSTGLTGSGTAWNTGNAYGETNVSPLGKFLIDGYTDVYKVSTVTSDTSATLYTAFIGTTASALTYTYFEDEYVLPSTYFRPLDYQMFSPDMNIPLIPRHEFRRRYPVIRVSGRPQVACLIDSVTSGTDATPLRKVVFYPYPDQTYIIPITYITSNIAVTSAGVGGTSLVSATDTPTMPLRYRHAIVYHALSMWYRDKKDDVRSDAAKADYIELMQRLIEDREIATHTTMRMQPSMGTYVRTAHQPYSYRGGRRIYDLNDEFDSFRR